MMYTSSIARVGTSAISIRRKAFAMEASRPMSEKEASNGSFLWNSTRKFCHYISCIISDTVIIHNLTFSNLLTDHSCDSPGQCPGKSVEGMLVIVSALMLIIYHRSVQSEKIQGDNSIYLPCAEKAPPPKLPLVPLCGIWWHATETMPEAI